MNDHEEKRREGRGRSSKKKIVETVLDSNFKEISRLYSQEPEISIDGVSVMKRCYQLFDPQYQKKLDRKAEMVIDSEKKVGRGFSKFSTLKKLKILDDARQDGGLRNREEKKLNNIKWQINGVLNSFHKPEDRNTLKENFGFQQEINEIEKHVRFKKRMSENMSRMSDLKIGMLVDEQKEKLGFINRKLDTETKLGKLCEEIH